MNFLENPYVIIAIFVSIFLLMGLSGLYFTMKSVKTAKGAAEKSFCGNAKIESEFTKAAVTRKIHSVVYISLSLDSMERVYSQAKETEVYEQVKRILLQHFSVYADGYISLNGKESFVAYNTLEEAELIRRMDTCDRAINEIFTKYGAMGVARVNFGYYLTSSNEVTYKTALARAKQACSMAEVEETAYCRWDSSNSKEFELKISIENSIRSDIDNNRFFLEYQPIVDAKTHKIVGAEVLSRLNSSKEGILSPYYFLPAVNSADISRKFDYYIFEKNCKWIASDKENRMSYVYTVNFSRHTLCDPNFAAQIMEIVEKYGISYSCVAVELIEDFSLDGSEKTAMIQNVVMLKEKGVMILLDDFGKGSTSFEDLLELDINIVKIDKSITRNGTNQPGLVLMKNIIRTVQDLGFQVLCEGIETEEEKNTAINAGCDLFQGFYLYRPMPATQLEKLLEKN